MLRSKYCTPKIIKYSWFPDGVLWLEAGAETELQVAVVVSRPGFYHLDNLQFRAKQLVSGGS